MDHGHFFALVAKYSLDAAVLGICRLYDRSNPRYEKDTVPNLDEYLKKNFNTEFARRIDTGILVGLGAPEETASKILARLLTNSDFADIRTKIFEIVDKSMPCCQPGSPLDRLFLHRNKTIAHQEQLTTVTEYVKEALACLPSLDQMLTLNKWAMDFCRLVVTALSNGTLLPHPTSARIAALNVVAKVLGKNFDPAKNGAAYEEWEDFYSRL